MLIVRGSLEKTAVEFSLEVPRVRQLLKECRDRLYDVRQGRPRPHRDDKILTAWNGEYYNYLDSASTDRFVKASIDPLRYMYGSYCLWTLVHVPSPTCSAHMSYFWGPS